jgi:hypothetical protein
MRIANSKMTYEYGHSKYASSLDDFESTVCFYFREFRNYRSLMEQLTVIDQMFGYICDNSNYLDQQDYFRKSSLEKCLTDIWKTYMWIGAHNYLKRLFPMSSALSNPDSNTG